MSDSNRARQPDPERPDTGTSSRNGEVAGTENIGSVVMRPAVFRGCAAPVTVLSAILLVAAAIAGVGARYTPLGCKLLGGRWGSVPGTCTTPLCYHLGGCAEWAYPLVPCSSIPLGTSVARAHFLMGEPSRRDGFSLYWDNFKDDTRVRATFRDGRLHEISCSAP